MQTSDSEHLTIHAWEEWLRSSRPGRQITYCTGFAARDRAKGAQLEKLLRCVWSAHELNQVTLVQEKIDFLAFNYIAIKKGDFL